MTRKRTARDLLVAWVEAEQKVAGEFSGNLVASYNIITQDAKAYAEDLGIPWDDEIIPEYARELIEADEEFRED